MEEMMSVLLQAHMWDFSDVVKKCCQFFSAKVQDHYNFIFNNTATLDLKNDLDDDAFFLLKWFVFYDIVTIYFGQNYKYIDSYHSFIVAGIFGRSLNAITIWNGTRLRG